MKVHELKNGLTLITNRFPGKTTGIDFAVNYGSVFEKPEQAGAAHFLEHLFFSCSRRFGRRKPFEIIEGSGGDLNAFTSREETHYYSRIQSSEFGKALGIFSECFNDALIRKSDTETERKIILNEIKESMDNPVRRVYCDFVAVCLDMPFGRKVIGSEKTVSRTSQAGLSKLLKANYPTKNCVMGIASGLPEQDIINLVQKSFHARKGKKNKPKPSNAKPNGREKIARAKTQQAHCCYGYPAIPAGHKNYFALELISTYLGDGLSSRLVQEIREKRGLSYAVNSAALCEKNHGLFMTYFSSEPGKIDKIRKIISREIAAIREKGIAPGALKQAKTQLIGSRALELENSFYSAKAGVDAFMYGHGTPGQEAGKIMSVKKREIIETANELFPAEKESFAALLPEKTRLKK